VILQGRETSSAALESGTIKMYPLETSVSKNGKSVELTPIEFRLLLLFMLHPLQTLTREQLLDKLGDEHGEFVDDNTLSVYIHRLRDKLEERPSDPEFIVTIRGVGYKWNQRSVSIA
jgi:two-component system, OmpR family, response regulator RegX3